MKIVNRIISLLAVIIVGAPLLMAADETRAYHIEIGDFQQLSVDNNIAVDYYCTADSTGYAIIEATPEKASWIIFDNNGKGHLRVQTSADCPYEEEVPSVRVYSSSLTKITNGGDSLVKTHGIRPTERFKATLIGNGRLVVHDVDAHRVDASIKSGNGTLVISGRCDEASLSDIGTGTIQADALEAKKVKASIIGTGTIGCFPIEELSISGMGSGDVFYRQPPLKTKNRGVGIRHNVM